jgi:hypothetical protein
MFGDAVRLSNSDSAGLGQNINSSRLKIEDFKKVKDTGFINGVEDIIKNTFLKSFQQDKFAIKSYSQLYDTQDPIISKGLLKIAELIETSSRKKLGRKDQLALINTLENDFINFITQNFNPEYVGKIDKVLNTLFTGENSVARQLLILKNKSKEQLVGNERELQDNIFIKELFPLIGKGGEDWNNVKIFSKRLDTFTSNQLTEAFREIKNLDLPLYNKLVHLGILQSGLNNSPITYTGLIPYETYNEIVKNSFKEFNQLSVQDKIKNISKFGELYAKNEVKEIGHGMYGKDFDVNKVRTIEGPVSNKSNANSEGTKNISNNNTDNSDKSGTFADSKNNDIIDNVIIPEQSENTIASVLQNMLPQNQFPEHDINVLGSKYTITDPDMRMLYQNISYGKHNYHFSRNPFENNKIEWFKDGKPNTSLNAEQEHQEAWEKYRREKLVQFDPNSPPNLAKTYAITKDWIGIQIENSIGKNITIRSGVDGKILKKGKVKSISKDKKILFEDNTDYQLTKHKGGYWNENIYQYVNDKPFIQININNNSKNNNINDSPDSFNEC